MKQTEAEQKQSAGAAGKLTATVTVIGCGRWGSLIAWYLAGHQGHRVTLYGRPESPHMRRFLAERRNDLLTLPDSVQKQVSKGEISTGHAKVLLGLPSAQLMTDAANEVAQRGLNVRQTEALCKKLAKPPKPPKPVDAFTRPKRAVEVEAALKEVLGSEVHVDYKNGKGSLKIDFYSDEMLQAFVELLGRYENQNQ